MSLHKQDTKIARQMKADIKALEVLQQAETKRKEIKMVIRPLFVNRGPIPLKRTT